MSLATTNRSPLLAAERSTHSWTVGSMVLAAADRHTGVALRGPDGEITFPELGQAAREIARGLIALGIRPGDRVAIFGNTRMEWTLADCGAICAGAVVVPVYATNSAEEARYVMAHSGARAVFCETAAHLEKVESVRGECPELEHVIALTDLPGAMSLGDLRARAGEVGESAPDDIQRLVEPGDLATIVYTSGTTGPPKGCRITHGNIMVTAETYENALDVDVDPLVIFMFLPLAHSLARVTQMVSIDLGATLAFWRGDPAGLLDDIRTAAPTHLPSVPRIFEKIHTKAAGGVEDGTAVKRVMFNWALGVGARTRAAERGGGGPGALLRAQHALADRLVLSKVRGLFGPSLRQALTGAAPIPKSVLEFFDACGVLILEGYGMTETCAASTLNLTDAFRFGTVGRPLPGFEVGIAEDGEILMRGPHIFDGYHREEAATAEIFDGEWLRSGDLGQIDEDGFLSITGRKKDLIITSSGKNITPVNIELSLRDCRWISQAVVYGDLHPYLVALITLDPDELPALGEHVGAHGASAAELAEHPGVLELIEKEVDAVNARFARIEQVKRFAIIDHDLTLAEGELTPTLKIKRALVYDRYRDVFEGLYETG